MIEEITYVQRRSATLHNRPRVRAIGGGRCFFCNTWMIRGTDCVHLWTERAHVACYEVALLLPITAARVNGKMKYCGGCRQTLMLPAFSKDKKMAGGYHHYCRKCRSAHRSRKPLQ